MTNVAHNGFGCPYCRTSMAEVPDEDIDSEEEEEDAMFNESSLRGFRFFTNRLNGEENDEEDIEDENEDEEYDEIDDLDDQVVPSSEFITRKLIEKGVTMEQLVQSLLFGSHEEYANNDTMSTTDNAVYGKIRSIISNYVPSNVEPRTFPINIPI
jgi:hypothetical protein